MERIDFNKDLAKFTERQLTAVRESQSHKFILYGGALGGGKLVADDACVLTPYGWKKGCDLSAGDRICNPDGSHQKIIQIKPRVTLPAYHLTFHDGATITVPGDHLWQAWRSGRRTKRHGKAGGGSGSAQVVETKTLCAWLDKAKQVARVDEGQAPWPLIPVCEEQHFNITGRYRASIPAYLLGVLLGDGCITKKVGLTCHQMDYSWYKRLFDAAGWIYSVTPKKGGEAVTINLRGETLGKVTADLERLRLLGTRSHNKFIPREYLFGSVENRYALLRGLMDTDGTISDGRVSYCTTSYQLAKDVRHLVRSLGGIATLTGKEPFYRDAAGAKVYGRQAYTLYIKHREPARLFSLPRKVERAKLKADCPMYLRLADYRVEGEVTGRCITVSNPNGLYITDDFVVTHNSYYIRWFSVRRLLWLAQQGFPGAIGMIACENYPALKDRQLSKIGQEFPAWLGKRYADHKDYGNCYILDQEYGGGIICFRNLDDTSKYQSAEFSFIMVDELTKNTYETFTFLRSRLRWPGLPDEDAIFVGATNPGGVGHGWCKQMWMDRDFPEEWLSPIDYSSSFVYIPSKADDNPHLDASYWAQLQTLPENLRKAFRDGDWDVFMGQAFPQFSKQIHVIPPHPVPRGAPLYMTYDWGFGKPFSIGWWWVDSDGRVYRFAEWYGFSGTADDGLRIPDAEVAAGIKEREQKLGIDGDNITRLAGHDCFAKRPDYKGGGQGPSTAEVFAEAGLMLIVGDPTRHIKIRQFRERLRVRDDGLPMLFVYDTCKQFIRTIPNLVMDDNDIEDIDTDTEDHIYDEAALVCMARPLAMERPRKQLNHEAARDWAVITGEIEEGQLINDGEEGAINMDGI